jgi:hypothetical protein
MSKQAEVHRLDLMRAIYPMYERPLPPDMRAGIAMISGIILIFAVPMIVAAVLISPSALHNLTHGLLFYVIVGLGLPIAGWQTFLAVFAFPPSGTRRIAAVLNIWLGGTVMVAAVFNLLMAVLDYSRDPDQIPPWASCWRALSSACSSRAVFGAHSRRSCRGALQFMERWRPELCCSSPSRRSGFWSLGKSTDGPQDLDGHRGRKRHHTDTRPAHPYPFEAASVPTSPRVRLKGRLKSLSGVLRWLLILFSALDRVGEGETEMLVSGLWKRSPAGNHSFVSA